MCYITHRFLEGMFWSLGLGSHHILTVTGAIYFKYGILMSLVSHNRLGGWAQTASEMCLYVFKAMGVHIWQVCFCFSWIKFLYYSQKNLYLKPLSGQWSVACSEGLFVEKGVSRVKGSQMIFFALLAACLRCNDRRERPVCGCSGDSMLFVSWAD